MFKLMLAAFVVGCVALTVNNSSEAQQVFGKLVQTGTDLTLTDPTTFNSLTADVYEFRITNNTAQGLFTFNNTRFNGSFIQGTTTTKTGASQPVFGPFTVAETFYADNNLTPTTFGTVVDSASEISASSIATLGQQWVAAGTTEAIAVLTVQPNTSVSFNFGEGSAVVGGQDVLIQVIPEPASLALLAMGTLAMVTGRRRQA